jgi:hypothetical protein
MCVLAPTNHPMESFEQLNIHNQIDIKFGLFKIQTIKIIKTKHNRKYHVVVGWREGGDEKEVCDGNFGKKRTSLADNAIIFAENRTHT